MTYQADPVGPVGQRIKAGPSPWAIVLLVIGVLIGGFGTALGVNTASRIVAGLAGGVVKVTRQRTLAALGPVVMGTGVRRSGPIEQAFQGGY